MNIKHKINDFLTKTTGYRLTKTSAIPDLRGKVTDPREGIYHAKTFPFIMDLPFDKGGDWLYSTYTENSSAVYYQAAKAALRAWGQGEKAVKKEIERLLTDFASLVNIDHPNQLLGLTREESKFNDAKKVYEMVLPWDNRSVEEVSKVISSSILEENKRYGLNVSSSLFDHGVSVHKIHLEVERIYMLMRSIKDKGFIYDSSNLVSVRVLVSGGEYVWRTRGGMHRAAILAAMDWKRLPVTVSQIINRDDVMHWPTLNKGLYSKDVALKVFDRVFFAKPPAVYGDWLKKIKSYEE
ncbi:hypothetical protein [Thiomicrospira sp. ALE5]|uniref:hypothetical protein n=1 Tax=Thiomicrospira sp. ALE5 TaxID=748650 RepID=UPI0008F43EE4|nr:hypothetical protein [Thiomicrospira sp. ALE5]SFR49279.1 hypothetical protein SAMN03092900_0131 [Thiomicrospira sp. ALE5]